MKSLLVCLSLLLFSVVVFAQANQGGGVPWDISQPDDRTGVQGYPSTHREMPSPSLKRLSGSETKLWQARASGKTAIIKKLMTESAAIVSTTGAKNRRQLIDAIETGACTLKSYKLTDFVVNPTSPTEASIDRSGTSIRHPRGLISYRVEQDGVCNGKPLPRIVNVVSTYAFLEEDWRNVYYEETAAKPTQP
jgi:hypothetical protein